MMIRVLVLQVGWTQAFSGFRPYCLLLCFFVFIFVFDSCFSRCSCLFFCSLPLVFLFVSVLSFPYPCVFVLLSVSCVREDGDVSVGPLGFFIVFISVFASCTVFFFFCFDFSTFSLFFSLFFG
ncbi:hypothetical protein NC652_025013 [Populus alba x Populus x berolinensis]|nr:hypothetical protein NC652_025013 [Populus alba x Populus x berolinensis]